MELFSPRHQRKFRISSIFQFLAAKRTHVEEAYAGDIVGLYDTGEYKIGDTLTEKENLGFLGIPNFAPEHFKRVILTTPLKSKQLRQGLKQLCEEGASQVFYPKNSNDIVVGVVGPLQFEVIQHRLESEYGAGAKFENCAFRLCRWAVPKAGSDLKKVEDQLDELSRSYDTVLARDAEERDAILVSSEYALNKARERFPDLDFVETSEVVSRAA
jgi:peptide chain release factor 3